MRRPATLNGFLRPPPPTTKGLQTILIPMMTAGRLSYRPMYATGLCSSEEPSCGEARRMITDTPTGSVTARQDSANRSERGLQQINVELSKSEEPALATQGVTTGEGRSSA